MPKELLFTASKSSLEGCTEEESDQYAQVSVCACIDVCVCVCVRACLSERGEIALQPTTSYVA